MAAKRSSRREFLSGVSARDAIGDVLIPGGLDLAPTSEIPRGSHLLHVGRRAMACEFEVFLNASESAAAIEPAIEALDLIDALEDQLTVYRDHSEVSRVNQTAAESEVEVEPQLYELLRRAVELHRSTGGAFDITSGPLSRTWGFFRRQGRMPEQSDLAEALERVGSQHLILDDHRRTIRFSKPGVEINLNAIGKGYALDRCVERLEESGVENFLIHGGASSIAARGLRLGGEPAPWSVALRHPLKRDVRLGEILLRDEALGTSGSANQFFHHQGRRYGHVLDPRNGRPTEGVLSTTLWAPNAETADALATAFHVLGYDQAREFCRDRDDLAAVFVIAGARTGQLELRTLGDARDRWAPADRSSSS